jgi:hypothetical protein
MLRYSVTVVEHVYHDVEVDAKSYADAELQALIIAHLNLSNRTHSVREVTDCRPQEGSP